MIKPRKKGKKGSLVLGLGATGLGQNAKFRLSRPFRSLIALTTMFMLDWMYKRLFFVLCYITLFLLVTEGIWEALSYFITLLAADDPTSSLTHLLSRFVFIGLTIGTYMVEKGLITLPPKVEAKKPLGVAGEGEVFNANELIFLLNIPRWP